MDPRDENPNDEGIKWLEWYPLKKCRRVLDLSSVYHSDAWKYHGAITPSGVETSHPQGVFIA